MFYEFNVIEIIQLRLVNFLWQKVSFVFSFFSNVGVIFKIENFNAWIYFPLPSVGFQDNLLSSFCFEKIFTSCYINYGFSFPYYKFTYQKKTNSCWVT